MTIWPCCPPRSRSVSTELAGLRRAVMYRLMVRYQQDDAFRFLIYAELAEAE